MRILGIYDGSGPKYHRVKLPLALMPEVEFTLAPTINDDNADCDILFYNRAISKASLQHVIDLRRRYGFKMVCDLDDHWQLSPDHILYEHYKANLISEVIEAYIQESDYVTVTHERLYNEAIRINPNVEIFPNAIPYFGQFTYPKTESEVTRLFWAGSVTHDKDMELLRNPVKRLHGVKMVMGGYATNQAFMRMASAFTNGGKLDHNLIQALPVEQYYAMYSECDICLIPLTVSTFNGYKSNLKILEAANMGCPVVVSKVDPYLDFPDDLVNYVSKQSDWHKHIKRLLDFPDEAKKQGEALRDYCRATYDFTDINLKRLNLFKKIAPVREISREVQAVG